MYRSRLSLHNIEETITRPIVINVLSGIKELLRINKDIPYIIGNEDKLDRVYNGNNILMTETAPRDDIILIEYTEDSTENEDLSMLVNNPDTYPFYYDKELESKATAVQHRRDLIITFKYYSKSKTHMNAVTNRLRMMISSDSMYKIHDLEYHFNLPHYFLKLLLTINELKNKDLSESERLLPEDYINQTFDNRVDFVNSLDGLHYKSEVGIREAQLGVLGHINTSLSDIKKEYDNSLTAWSIEFVYKLTYDKPIAILVDYPMSVFNRPIPKEFRLKSEKAMPKLGVRSKSNQSMMDFIYKGMYDPIVVKPGEYYFKIPKEDSLELPPPLPFTTRLFSVMVMVDRENPTEIFALDELPDIEFKPNITKLIEKEADYVGDRYGSIINFSLYDNHKLCNIKVKVLSVLEEVDINPDTNQPIMVKRLKLVASEPLSVRGNYRLSVSMVTDLSVLKSTVKKRLNKVFKAIDEDIALAEKEAFEERVNNGFEPIPGDSDISLILTEINKTIVDKNPNITTKKLVDEFKKYNVVVPHTLSVNETVSIIKTYPELINRSPLISSVAKMITYHGIPVIKSLTSMDFINVFSINSNALKNKDSIVGDGTVNEIETVFVENISEKIYTRQYTMVLGSLLRRK